METIMNNGLNEVIKPSEQKKGKLLNALFMVFCCSFLAYIGFFLILVILHEFLEINHGPAGYLIEWMGNVLLNSFLVITFMCAVTKKIAITIVSYAAIWGITYICFGVIGHIGLSLINKDINKKWENPVIYGSMSIAFALIAFIFFSQNFLPNF